MSRCRTLGRHHPRHSRHRRQIRHVRHHHPPLTPPLPPRPSLIRYLPFFSNCREFDSYIPFYQLTEDAACEFPPSATDRDDNEYPFEQYFPDRIKYGNFPHQDDVAYVDPFQIIWGRHDGGPWDQPIADWCERDVTCAFEEDMSGAGASLSPVWYDADSGTTLFTMLQRPISFLEYVGRASAKHDILDKVSN